MQEPSKSDTPTHMQRAKNLASTVVASMKAQGYRHIEYILTDNQLRVIASASDKAPKTEYLSVPMGPHTLPSTINLRLEQPETPRRFVL
ncbi:MAG: hypothetical protein GY883_07845 [Shimia sp.]|nr:hypothetical protein [Shimia sp.]